LNAVSRYGFRTGLLTKKGAIVKNWKDRYFTLTWNCLSYYEPESHLFIQNISLLNCIKVVPVSEEKPYSFQLITKDRTYIFLSQTKNDRQQWVEALEAMIAIHDPKVMNLNSIDWVKKIAFHVFRILNGIRILTDTIKSLREMAERMCVTLFDLLRSYAAQLGDRTDLERNNRSNEILARCMTLKQVVLALKKEIPPEHRIQSEEINFDIAAEQRRINVHLRSLCGDNSHNVYPFVFENVEDDIRPLVIDTIKFVVGC